jgi:hypothetical protein
MDRDEHVKLLSHTAAILLQSPDVPLPISSQLTQKAVDSAEDIVEAAVKAVKLIEETDGLYE